MFVSAYLSLFPSHLSLFLLGHITLLVDGDESISLLDHGHVLGLLHLVEFKLVTEIVESLVVEVQNIVEAAIEDFYNLRGNSGRNILQALIFQEAHLLLDLL